jgi:hypothetical protein
MYESNPLKVKVRDVAFDVFKQGAPLDVAEYEIEETGKWELMIRIKPETDSATRNFKLKITEQL